MPLFLSEEEFARIAHDSRLVAERADDEIRDLRRQLDTVSAEADAAAIAAEQTCSHLEQRYSIISADLDRLKSDNEQLSAASERHASQLAEVQAEKHQLHLKAIEKDGEIERLHADLSELHKYKRHSLDLVEQKDAEIRERNTTIQSYLEKIVALTDNAAAKETRLQEIEMELTRSHATFNRVNQEKELLEKHNNWLDEELKAKTNSLAEMRRHNMDIESQMSARISDLEREIIESSSKLKRRNERVAELEQRVSYLEKELSSSKESAATNEQHLNAELSTVSKLVELYKESSSEWSKKSGELEGVIKALETHMAQIENENKEKLEKEVSTRQELEKALAETREKLEKCEAELENARKGNELSLLLPSGILQSDSSMDALLLSETGTSREQQIVPKIPAGISGTALAASLLRDGWSLTKMYEKYQDAADALRHEQWGRRHAESVLERILHEIEQKAELIMDERAEHERMLEAYSLLNQKLEQALLEHGNLENTIRNLECELKRRERNHNIAEREIDDLQKQIAVLLKECQDIQIRCGVGSISTSSIAQEHGIDEIDLTGHMSFRDISGLVAQNVELRSQVQNLSSELERRDEELKEGYQIEVQKSKEEATAQVEAMLKRSEEQGRMIESLHTSVSMYKRLYEEERKSHINADALPKGPSGEERNGDAAFRIESSQHEVSKKEHDQLLERARNLEQDVTALKNEVSTLRLDRDKLTLEFEFSKERLNSSMLELDHQRKEANAVSARNVELTQLLVDYQKRIRESSDSVQASEENMRKLSMQVSFLKHEKEILVSSEKRAMQEVDNLSQKVHRLQSSLDTIQTTEEIRENARASEKKKQEDHIKQLEQEWAQAKKDLQEEKDRVLSLTLEKKMTSENLVKQVEELRKELSDARNALSAAEARAAVAESKCSALERKAGKKSGISGMDSIEVHDDTWKLKDELAKQKEEAQANKTFMLQYKEISQTTEAALKQIESAHEEYKTEAERSKRTLEEEVASLRNKVSELQKSYELKCQEAASAIEEKEKELISANLEVSVLKDEISEKAGQVETLQLQVSSMKDDLESEHKRWRTAQDNYERQVILQSETIQELTNTSKDLSTLQSEIAKLREMLDEQKAENERLKSSWEHEKQELQKERDEAQRNYNETNEQNKILHNRLDALHVRMADKEMTSSGYSMDSKKESDVQNVITYLRRSKEIAETEISLLKKEKMRLQSELEMAVKTSQEAQAHLRSKSDGARATVLKDEEYKSLQFQVREINLLRESNIQLREESKHNFEECQKHREVANKAKMEAENSRNLLLVKQIDLEACQKELEMRKAEVEILNARITELVESNKKIDLKEHEQTKDELQQIKALLKDNENELKQTKNLISEKEKLVTKLEENLAKCQADLAERQNKLNDALQAEAALKADNERQRKMGMHATTIRRKMDGLAKGKEEISREKESISKEKESLVKEREGLLKEKSGFLKQIEELKSSRKAAGESSSDQSGQEKDTRIQMLEKLLERERSDKERERGEKEKEKAKRVRNEQVVQKLVENTKTDKQKLEDELADHKKVITKLLEAGTAASQIPSQGALDKQALSYFDSVNNLESNISPSNEGQAGTSLPPETSIPEPSIPPARQSTPPPPPPQTRLTTLSTKRTAASTTSTKPSEGRRVRIKRPALEHTATTATITTTTTEEQPPPDAEMSTLEPPLSTEEAKETEVVPAGASGSRKRGPSLESKEKEESGAQDEAGGSDALAISPPQKKLKEDIVLSPESAIVEEPKSPEIIADTGMLEPVPEATPSILVEELEADQPVSTLPIIEEIIEETKEEDVNMANNDEIEEGEKIQEEEEEEEEEEQPVEEEGELVQSEGEEDREEGELTEDPELPQDEANPSLSGDEIVEMLEADEVAKSNDDIIEEKGDDIETAEEAVPKGSNEDIPSSSVVPKGNNEDTTSSSVVVAPEIEKSPQRGIPRLRSTSRGGTSSPVTGTETSQGSVTPPATGTDAVPGESSTASGRTINLTDRARRNAAFRQAGMSSSTPPTTTTTTTTRGRGRPAGTSRVVTRGRARGSRRGL